MHHVLHCSENKTFVVGFPSPNSRFSSIPAKRCTSSEMSRTIVANDVSQADVGQLFAKLDERSWEKIFTVSQLRPHLKSYELFRRILSSLWLAIIYRSVQQDHAGNMMVELKRAKEVGVQGPKEMMSKYCRAGRAAWLVMSKLDPGVLAIVDLAEPTSKKALAHLLCQKDLSVGAVVYRQHVYKVFDYLVGFLKEKQSELLELLKTSVEEVCTKVKVLEGQSAGGSSHEQPLTVDLPSVSLEVTFNKNTHICYIVPYKSEIFRRITSGDLTGTLRLLWSQEASIFNVDPFGLPLLYVSAILCLGGIC